MVISLDELFGLAADGLQPRIILVVDVSHGADVVVGPRRHADDAGPQGQVGRGGKQRARRVRAEPRAGAQRHAGERRQRRAPRVERAAERVREGAGRRRRHVRSRIARQFLRAGATTLFDSTQIPGEIVDLLAVRASVIEQAVRKAVQALLRGWFDAIDYMKREPEGCRAAHGHPPADDRRAVPGRAAGPAHSVARGEPADARRRDAGAGGHRPAR